MSNKQCKKILIKLYGTNCMLCKRKLKEEYLQFHHIKPKSKGGLTTIENGGLVCSPCHELIHLFAYEEMAYTRINKKITKYKRSVFNWQ